MAQFVRNLNIVLYTHSTPILLQTSVHGCKHRRTHKFHLHLFVLNVIVHKNIISFPPGGSLIFILKTSSTNIEWLPVVPIEKKAI